tara:strand:- start:17328 stop:17897 length:570 start_codon:yes stop_codon:yes gene_type:complete
MTGVSYVVDTDEVLAGLSRLQGRLENASGFYKNVGEHLVNSTQDGFVRETSPEGVPWQKLMPSTIRNRARKGQTPIQILRASRRGGLAASINARASADDVRIGSPKPYAAIHQLGGTINKPARKAVIQLKRDSKTGEIGNLFVKKSRSNVVQDVNIPAHTVTIPARPYLGVSSEDQKVIIEIADAWLSD